MKDERPFWSIWEVSVFLMLYMLKNNKLNTLIYTLWNGSQRQWYDIYMATLLWLLMHSWQECKEILRVMRVNSRWWNAKSTELGYTASDWANIWLCQEQQVNPLSIVAQMKVWFTFVICRNEFRDEFSFTYWVVFWGGIGVLNSIDQYYWTEFLQNDFKVWKPLKDWKSYKSMGAPRGLQKHQQILETETGED